MGSLSSMRRGRAPGMGAVPWSASTGDDEHLREAEQRVVRQGDAAEFVLLDDGGEEACELGELPLRPARAVAQGLHDGDGAGRGGHAPRMFTERAAHVATPADWSRCAAWILCQYDSSASQRPQHAWCWSRT